MPIYEFVCPSCGEYVSELCSLGSGKQCPKCLISMERILSCPGRVGVKRNAGRLLKTRVALDDELRKQGFTAPLFSSEKKKDIARWVLKKEGLA